jgi:hypothetical protein
MIGQKFNFDEVFFRDLTVCVLDTLEGRLNWINRFSSGNVPVNVPIYYSMTGDDRFLLDSFQDDIVSENRYVELNTELPVEYVGDKLSEPADPVYNRLLNVVPLPLKGIDTPTATRLFISKGCLFGNLTAII